MSLYVALAWNGIQFVLRKGDNSYKKCQKRIIVSRKHLNKSYIYIYIYIHQNQKYSGAQRGRDRMVVGLTTTCVISAYHH
jgi:hypothetical protein